MKFEFLDGDGNGCGDGYINGDGCGNGYINGDGYGNGYGDGNGYGSGNGNGDGYGDGYGDGSGDGDGDDIPTTSLITPLTSRDLREAVYVQQIVDPTRLL